MAPGASNGDQAELPLLERNLKSSTWLAEAPADGSGRPHDADGAWENLSREGLRRPDDQRQTMLGSQLRSGFLSASQQPVEGHERHGWQEEDEDDVEPGCTNDLRFGATHVQGPHTSLPCSDASAQPLSWSFAWKRILEGSIHLPGPFVVVVEDEAKRDPNSSKQSGTQ